MSLKYWFLRTLKALWRRLKAPANMVLWRLSGFGAEAEKKFRNIHENETCVIICNGPSLSLMDFSKLSDRHTFAMNRAYMDFNKWGFDPSYYCCINELVLKQFSAEISKLQMPCFLNFNSRSDFANENIHYISPSLSLRVSESFHSQTSTASTVTFVTLMIAIRMGFKNIAIIGLDHSYAGPGRPNEVLESSGEDKNHPNPKYFDKGVLWEYPDLKANEEGYELINKYALDNQINIMDCTIDGRCEVFEKCPLDEFLDRFE